ncbi:MAG: efflux RND transporter periplasmic adaptor subunit [Bacteroidales bacterium]|nr:efflux RND transporter periplasmic adaptor subunit [Bacteroidales bacterium]MBN2698921.1 efflux RND transporter periplasmic adaptor subunit [Bacteroidales bacterium]
MKLIRESRWFVTVIMFLPLLWACQNLKDNKGEAVLSDTETPQEILVTKAQFEFSSMRIGDPRIRIFQQKVRANGYIKAAPNGAAQVGTLVPGRINQVLCSTGDYVRKGDVLYSIESHAIIELQQEYAESFSRLKALKVNYERQKLLAGEQISSLKEFNNVESEYMSLQAKVEGLKLRLQMMQISPAAVEDGSIKPAMDIISPIDGFISQQDLVVGQYLEPNENVMEIINTDEFRLNLYLFEKDLKDLVIGQTVLFFTPDEPGRKYKAHLSQIGKSIHPETKSVLCIARLSPENRKTLVNGLYVMAEIITCEREALSIPNEALTEEEDRYYVFAVYNETDEDYAFHKVAVKTGTVTDSFTEVLDPGLKNILLTGAYNLSSAE